MKPISLLRSWTLLGIVCLVQVVPNTMAQAVAYASPHKSYSTSRDTKLKTALQELQRRYNVEIIFDDHIASAAVVSGAGIDINASFEQNLEKLLRPLGLGFKKSRKNTYVILGPSSRKTKVTGSDLTETNTTSSLAEMPLQNATPEQLSEAQNAKDRTIKGKVKDESGSALPGVSVVLKGTTVGTITDTDGNFTLGVPDQDEHIIVASFVGYKTQEIMVGNRTSIDISLDPSDNKLEEVVVVGYGSVRKSDLTGSVGVVKGEVLQQRPASSLNQQLSGQIAGVNVTTNSGRPGGRASIRIRGISSISVSNNPLYVIDGVILNAVDLMNGSSPIDYLNPNDIESIEVLKDASSTAIYGARGANGVILVTTKRGNGGGGKVTYDTYFSVGVVPRLLPVLNSKEFLMMEDTYYQNAKKFDPVGWATGTKYPDPKLKRTDPKLFDSNGNPLYDTNWQKEAFQKALTQNHQLGFTGGNEKGSYGAFLNYRNETGVVTGSWQKRFSGRFVFDHQIKPWLKAGGSLSYTDQNEKQIDQLQGGGIVVMRQVMEELPIIPVKYPDGTWGSNRDYPAMEGGDSPIRVSKERLYFLRTQTMLGNMYANIKLADGLELRSTIGTNVINQRNDYFAAAGLQYISANGDASVTSSRFNSWQFENYLTYVKTFSEIHSVNAMAGLSWQHVDRFDNAAKSQVFSDPFFQFNNLAVGSTALPPTSASTAYGLNSYFARINYSLKNKYLLTLTGRIDGSSKFGDANRYAFFPSAALAWRVKEEEFLRNVSAISNLKLRTSFGATGNSEIPPYRAEAALASYDVIFGGARSVGLGVGRMANSNLRWEKTYQVDFGAELGLFNGRINIELDLYRRKVDQMLLDAPTPPSTGYNSIFTNIGSMENKGVEVALNTVNFRSGDFSWNTTFNISVNKNKILSLSGGGDVIDAFGVLRVGQPVGSFYGRVLLNAWRTSEAEQAKKYNSLPGDYHWADLNNDGVVNDDDRTIIGKGIPTGYGTFLNTIRYKNLSLTVDLQYVYGNQILDRGLHTSEARQGIANSTKNILNAWTETNQETRLAQVRYFQLNNAVMNDSYKVKEGSFIRGRNLLLSYNLPGSIVSKLKLDNIRAYASVQNFFVITKYKGYDPEVSNASSQLNQGLALYDYPKPRVFMLGLGIGL